MIKIENSENILVFVTQLSILVWYNKETNEREKRNRYYKHIVKRHLNDIREHIGLSTNEMERSYYNTRYAVQLSIYAEALGIQEKYLERFIQK